MSAWPRNKAGHYGLLFKEVGGTVAGESALTLLSRVRAPPLAPWPDGGPESLRSPCCGLVKKKSCIKWRRHDDVMMMAMKTTKGDDDDDDDDDDVDHDDMTATMIMMKAVSLTEAINTFANITLFPSCSNRGEGG
ncbi:hypothetical protein PoB_007541300 [Plakobranchus ocellatus]|uniref:Uncharacterized protein n=1 Tax=Plakobranchus ocellatus TaxID=259542 RepID=A0AAV4DXS6_9GAST|nr:hypothetical protein PoB_007541300 [Plakobranchus ocellatus]